MATGVPGKNSAHTHRPVHLAYEGRRSEEQILTQSFPPFDEVHPGPSGRRLYFGDNIAVLRFLSEDPTVCGNVALVYIDPPFSTQGTFLSRKQRQAYEDTLSGAQYVEFLRERLVLLRELLSDQGSIYLHLDEKMVLR